MYCHSCPILSLSFLCRVPLFLVLSPLGVTYVLHLSFHIIYLFNLHFLSYGNICYGHLLCMCVYASMACGILLCHVVLLFILFFYG